MKEIQSLSHKLSYCGVLLELDSREVPKLVHVKRGRLTRGMHFNLPHMSVTAILVVTQHCYLYHVGSYRSVLYILDWYHLPSCNDEIELNY